MDIREFKNTYTEFAPSVIWDWCAKPTAEEIDSQLSYFSDMGIKAVYIRPSKGLAVPYLSDDFFELVRTALRRSSRYNIEVWLFDENSPASGNGGGEITSVKDYRLCDFVKINKEDLLKTDKVLNEDSSPIVLRDISSVRASKRAPMADITDKFVSQCFAEEVYDKYMRSCRRFVGYELKGFVSGINIPEDSLVYSQSAFEKAGSPETLKYAKKLLAKDKDTLKTYYSAVSDAVAENFTSRIHNKCEENSLSLSVSVNGKKLLSRQKQYILADTITLFTDANNPDFTEFKLAESISAQFKKPLNVFLSTGKFAPCSQRYNKAAQLCAMGAQNVVYDSVAFSLTDRRKYEENSLVLSSFSENDISGRISRFSKVASETVSSAEVLVIMNTKNISFFYELCENLKNQNTCFHIVEEDIFKAYAGVRANSITIGDMTYSAVIYDKDFGISSFSGRKIALDTSLSAKNCIVNSDNSTVITGDRILINRRKDGNNEYIFITAPSMDTQITVTGSEKALFCADSSNGEIYEVPERDGIYTFILKGNKTVMLILSNELAYDMMPPVTDELMLSPAVKKCDVPFALSYAGENIVPLKSVNACFGRKSYRENNIDNLHKEFYALSDGETVKAKYPFTADLDKIGTVNAYFENAENFDFIEINGKRLDTLTESAKEPRFSGIDITPYLADGKNTIAIEYKKQNNYTPEFESFAPTHLYTFNPTTFEPVYLAGEFDFDGEKLTELNEYKGNISDCGMPYYYGSLTYAAKLPENELSGNNLTIYGDFDICRIKIGRREKTFYSEIPTMELFNLDSGAVAEITIFNTPYNLLRASNEKAKPFGITKIELCE